MLTKREATTLKVPGFVNVSRACCPRVVSTEAERISHLTISAQKGSFACICRADLAQRILKHEV